jgi:hypothetical protein
MRTFTKFVCSILLVLPWMLTPGAASVAHATPVGTEQPAGHVKGVAPGSPGEDQMKSPVVVAASTAAPHPIISVEGGPLQVQDTLPPPPGFTQASHCVVHEGIHYIRKGGNTVPPILSYDENGRLVSLEYIVALQDLQTGVSWKGLPGVATRAVDHVDIDFYPTGREGNPAPFYSVHLYFINVEEQEQICPKSTEMEPVRRAIQSQ